MSPKFKVTARKGTGKSAPVRTNAKVIKSVHIGGERAKDHHIEQGGLKCQIKINIKEQR